MTSATTLRDPLQGVGTRRSPAPPMARDREGLVAVLQVVDEDGWDCRAAQELLDYVRLTVVRPHVALTRLRGLAADQAEATAWAATWEALRAPSIRTVRSPWGVLWSTARRAVLGECVAGTYCTSIRAAWSLAASGPEPKLGSGPAARTRPLGAITIRVRSPTPLDDRLLDRTCRGLVVVTVAARTGAGAWHGARSRSATGCSSTSPMMSR